MIIRSMQEETTLALGRRIGAALRDGDVILLRGEMGAGKSVFSRGVARGIGVEGPVPSPTFTLMNIHEGTSKKMYHFDLYRLDDADALYEMGFEEYIPSLDGATFIEWPEMAEEAMPEDALTATLTYGDDGLTRRVELTPGGAFDEKRIDEIVKQMEASDEHPDD